MRRVQLATAVAVFALAGPACFKAAQAPGTSLPLYVDGALIGRVPVAALSQPVELASLLPEAARDPRAWVRLEGTADGGRTLTLRRPSDVYPGQAARIYLDAQGSPSLGLFRGDDDRLPASVRELRLRPTTSLSDVVSIEITTAMSGPTGASLEQDALLDLVAANGVHHVTMADLGPLPRAKPPVGPRSPAWDVRDIAALAGPMPQGAGLRLDPQDGAPVILDAITLARPDRLALLKVNRRGEKRLRLYETGKSSRLLLEIADVRTITIL